MAVDINSLVTPDLLPNSRKMMLAALMQRMQQPQYSAGGAAANALAMGLQGWIENNEDGRAYDTAKGLAGPLPGSAPAAPTSGGNVAPAPLAPPTLSPSTPPRSMNESPTGPMVAALRGGPSEADMAANDVADSLSATGMKVSPEAVARLMKVESNNDPRNQSGSYVGATQMGPDTFKEAGGRLGGLTFPEYKNGSLTQQAWAYPDWLQQYNVPGKLAAAGVDTGSMTPAMQYGTLQAAQFAPNGGAAGNAPPQWMTALGQGNSSVPATNTPQAKVLGDTSVGRMAQSFPGQQTQMADASGNVTIPRNAQPAGPAAQPTAQVAQAAQGQPQQLPQVPQIPMHPDYDKAVAYTRAAEARGDKAAATKGYEIIRQMRTDQANAQTALQVEAAKKLMPSGPTYGDLHPDLDLRPSEDGSGAVNAFDKKTGAFRGQVTPPQGQVAPITLPNGRTVTPPAGLSGAGLKDFNTKVAQEAGAAASGNLTQSQTTAQGYANRMQEAEPIIRKNASAVNGIGPYTNDMPFGSRITPDDYQKYKAAQGAFISGMLRQESGANIRPDEFADYDKAFFPQPGNPPEVVQQKERMREVVLDAMKKGAGPGYTGPPAQGSADPVEALGKAQVAISKGAPRDAVIKRLQGMGIDPRGL